MLLGATRMRTNSSVATKKIELPPDMMFITIVHMRKISKALTEFKKMDKKDLQKQEVIFAFLICSVKVSRKVLLQPEIYERANVIVNYDRLAIIGKLHSPSQVEKLGIFTKDWSNWTVSYNNEKILAAMLDKGCHIDVNIWKSLTAHPRCCISSTVFAVRHS
jgi:hypothetical protein